MALIAVQFTAEIVLMIIALYFGFDSGIIRKLSAIGFCVIGISLVLQPQVYVSDLTSTPLNVTLNFPGPIQNAMVLLYSLISFAVVASAFIDVLIIIKEENEIKKLEKFI